MSNGSGTRKTLNVVPTTAPKHTASAQNPLARLKDLLEYMDASKNGIELSDEEFFAEVLYMKKYTQDEFKSKYSDNEFQKHILSTKSAAKDNVFEIFVNIPEMTGMLPFPNFKMINEARSFLRNPEQQSNVSPSAKATLLNAQKELLKIERYPRAFYVAATLDLTPHDGNSSDICRIKVPKKNNKFFPSYHYFTYVEKAQNTGQSR